MDYATLPPEVNSGRMYAGPGSGPMLAAASAWQGLAAELRVTAGSYGAVLAALTGEEWYGPASASMAAAATPYVAWMSATAVQAEQTAIQAQAAAGAYEAAFAATVPPSLIAANRTQLAALIATNIFGQNTPAIAATEAQYAEMWAQDAMAMYGYAGSAAAATQLSPFFEPQQTTSATGLAAQAAALSQAAGTSAANQQSTLSQLITMIPSALQGLSGSTSGTSWLQVIWDLLTGSGPAWWQAFWNAWGPNANVWNTITSTGLFVPGSTFAPFMASVLAGAAAADATQDVGAAAAEVGNALAGPGAAAGGFGGAVSAGLGNSGIIGTLSVPPTWTATAPLPSPLGTALGGTPMIAPPPAVAAGMPGMPVGNIGGQPFGRAVPQYGFRPTFVARPPAAG
ncbi:PPE family protein [Mycobacterium simiae]|uniref:PPE family protein n=2 Tax=Mycobacterium simiae TaxID=1784 RepID=A0A5B1BUF2_MYCSI|nr:PPE family protein [Mycobacterium simiae]